ncbi:MAG: hypothetical protein JO323_17905 [Acidobacteriia bacterium]|nr:hypothetical protein [Terriglobia bacterium]
MKRLPVLILLCPAAALFLQSARAQDDPAVWTFVVSGDSRNCGDLIMPVIAGRAKAAGARFYWHLGDLRALFKVDEDYAGLYRNNPAALTMDAYKKNAWHDFEQNQVRPFRPLPFFLGIGNHEVIGRTQQDFVAHFQKMLDIRPIKRQREADSPDDHTIHTYYHWRERGAGFLNLDNANSIFDESQLAWALKVIASDEADPEIKLLVVGMHESLPDSYSIDHSMNQGTDHGASGRVLYKRLLEFHQKSSKPVYVFSSHSHYYLANIYNTDSWKANGGVLPGWLIGTAGAQHYAVPPEVKSFAEWAENQYGYGVVTVNPDAAEDALQVKFVPVNREDLSADAVARFGEDTADFCFTQNRSGTPARAR